uniref:Subunit VI of cytochrome b6/f complex n=1 Tax=Chloropicon roscoffensis TaxID=1461544 RepID=A0A4D6C2K6_9CHLO|nr:subunit VI of cytochrome b6/f complex [Chloropicon roscoffensis]QBX97972.1 subunit VI of cytochrome b6/f complex [Chloropicon roscoffensis]QBX98043.1 subunit VI of cytochrome b6/f complex [Chloropicon roscoffensis]
MALFGYIGFLGLALVTALAFYLGLTKIKLI